MTEAKIIDGKAFAKRIRERVAKEVSILKEKWPLKGTESNPLLKTPIDTPLDVGVRAINSLVSVGRGQRIGIRTFSNWTT